MKRRKTRQTDEREKKDQSCARKKKPQKTLNSGGVGLFSDDGRAHQRERTDFLKKKKKTKKTKKETKKNLCVIMEEPEEDAPDVPPVDDENVALQHSGLHNVSNTCYLNATVQVKHSSEREL